MFKLAEVFPPGLKVSPRPKQKPEILLVTCEICGDVKLPQDLFPLTIGRAQFDVCLECKNADHEIEEEQK